MPQEIGCRRESEFKLCGEKHTRVELSLLVSSLTQGPQRSKCTCSREPYARDGCLHARCHLETQRESTALQISSPCSAGAMLWVDKYRPSKFDQFTINQDKAAALTKLVEKGASGPAALPVALPVLRQLRDSEPDDHPALACRRLPACAAVRSAWGGQEDDYEGAAAPDLWRGSNKGQG